MCIAHQFLLISDRKARGYFAEKGKIVIHHKEHKDHENLDMITGYISLYALRSTLFLSPEPSTYTYFNTINPATRKNRADRLTVETIGKSIKEIFAIPAEIVH